MTNKFIILGCGASTGVPVAGHEGAYWGQCDPNNPKNSRLRASIYVEYQEANILIDTSPDLRQQLLTHNLHDFDAVLMSHLHGDHCHGIGEFWHLSRIKQRTFDIYADAATGKGLQQSFDYLFGSNTPPLKLHTLKPDDTIAVITKGEQQVTIKYMNQRHGPGTSLGFRFGNMAYSTDFNYLDETAIAQLQDLDLWIVDCLSYSVKPTHNHLELTMQWIDRVKPKRAILTHMCQELDYNILFEQLPEWIQPAYDGMTMEF